MFDPKEADEADLATLLGEAIGEGSVAFTGSELTDPALLDQVVASTLLHIIQWCDNQNDSSENSAAEPADITAEPNKSVILGVMAPKMNTLITAPVHQKRTVVEPENEQDLYYGSQSEDGSHDNTARAGTGHDQLRPDNHEAAPVPIPSSIEE